jgi:hypothetical protein
MDNFISSLVREKMTFTADAFAEVDPGEELHVIRSNRIFLNLTKNGRTEKIAVRAQTMHVTLLLASKVMFSFFKNGLFLIRPEEYDWQQQWESILSSYEQKYNPNVWAAVYINAKPVFKTTDSPYIDIVEKCALLNIDNYDATVGVAEEAFKQAGKAVSIGHESHTAAVFSADEKTVNCGVIDRSGGKNVAFNFIVAGGDKERRLVQALAVTASFVEALNLRRIVRETQMRIRMEEITTSSSEAIRMRAAAGRLMALTKMITTFEEMYEVKYRPAKPDFYAKD